MVRATPLLLRSLGSLLFAVVAGACSSTATGIGGEDAGADGTATSSSGHAPPPIVTIRSVRDPASATRPAEGAVVHVSGVVVTGVKSTGTNHSFNVQDPTADAYGGILVFLAAATPTVTPGDVVDVVGVYKRFHELDEIDVQTGGVTRTGSAAVPSPIVVAAGDLNDTGARAHALESMLVEVRDVVATSPTLGVDFEVRAGAGAPLIVTSFLASDVAASPFPAAVGDAFASIVGLAYIGGANAGPFNRKIAPRGPADVVRK